MSTATMNGNTAGHKSARKQSPAGVDNSTKNKQQSQPPAPKAWSGQNPSTLRASSSTTTPPVNGTDKPLPKPPQQSQQKSNGDSSSNDKHAHDRALFLLANFIGQDVTLTLKNGEQFTGIFSGASLDNASRQQYSLKMTKRTTSPVGQQVNGHTELASEYIGDGEDSCMSFDMQDTTSLDVQGVTMAASQPTTNGSATSSFRTDTEISGRGPVRERELQRWSGGEGESLEDMSLDGSGSAGWDQFAANEQMYGVQSTYNEDFYTTSIDRSDPNYRQREAYAKRLASEIEGSSAADAHRAEERQRDADRSDGLDEEERYSGVKRDTALPKRAAGAYVPPSQRPITNTPTVRGAPFDPAIISTTKPAANKPDDVVAPAKQSGASQDQTSADTETAAANAATVAPKKSGETTAEDHIRNTTDAFKQFANNEKLKIRQTQESKRQAIRHEKNVKLNDLKKFAANFKLKSRVPDDLVPILAKDHEKQLEIQKRADDAAKEEEVARTERVKQKTSPQASNVASPVSSKDAEPSLLDRNAAINHRTKVSGNPRGQMPGGPVSGRGMGGGRGMQPYGRHPIPPLPENMKMPGAPMAPMPVPSETGPLSPGAAKRLNVNAKAFEFRPGANAFTPTGATPSPQRNASDAGKSVAPRAFFSKKIKKADKSAGLDSMDATAWPDTTQDFNEEQKKLWATNGSQPQPYRAPPTWGNAEKNTNANMKESVPKRAQLPTSQGPSPLHTPGPNMPPQIPHVHQLPSHMQQAQPMGAAPLQRGQYMAPPHHGPQPGQFDPRMGGQAMYGPNGSVQNSPRFPQAQMAYGQQVPMPQFGGQGGGPNYGMSPSMHYRQPNMQPQNNGMMMPQRNQYPPMPSGPFPGPPPQFQNQQMQGQPPFMNGPPHQGGGYSPMPPHAQPPHMGPPPGGYNASPRPGPHMMQHTNSHQGFQGSGNMGQPPFAPSPAHHPPYMGQRQYSHGAGPPQYGMQHMTPRQGQAMPHQNMSPMGGMPQGEDGK